MICLNVLYIVPVYYVLSWTPQLVADSGFTPAEAASVALLLNLGGIVGGVAFGWVSEVLGWKRAAVGTLLCFSVAIVAFSHAPADLGVLRVLGTATGFFLFAGACALHTIVSRSFGDHTRATGAGLVLGVGRTASAIAPLATGILFSVGFGREGVSFAMALAVVVSAVLLIGHRAAVAH